MKNGLRKVVSSKSEQINNSKRAYYTEWSLFCEDELTCFIMNIRMGQVMLQGDSKVLAALAE